MTEHFITLSTTEPNNYVGLLKMRQGDTNTQEIEATITANGQLFKFDNLSVFFNAVLPNGNVIRDKVTEVDYINSKLNYIVSDSFLQEVAQVTAWFSFENGEKIIDSTKNFQYSVIPGWKECIPQGNYIYELSEIQREIEQIIGNKDFTTLLSELDFLKTNIAYLDNNFKTIEVDLNNSINDKLSQISSVPETFANLAALKSTYPNGKNGLFVTADTGHKYIWSNGSWTDAGIYQSVGIAEGSVTGAMIADKTIQDNNVGTINLSSVVYSYADIAAATIWGSSNGNVFFDKTNVAYVKTDVGDSGLLFPVTLPVIPAGSQSIYIHLTYYTANAAAMQDKIDIYLVKQDGTLINKIYYTGPKTGATLNIKIPAADFTTIGKTFQVLVAAHGGIGTLDVNDLRVNCNATDDSLPDAINRIYNITDEQVKDLNTVKISNSLVQLTDFKKWWFPDDKNDLIIKNDVLTYNHKQTGDHGIVANIPYVSGKDLYCAFALSTNSSQVDVNVTDANGNLIPRSSKITSSNLNLTQQVIKYSASKLKQWGITNGLKIIFAIHQQNKQFILKNLNISTTNGEQTMSDTLNHILSDSPLRQVEQVGQIIDDQAIANYTQAPISGLSYVTPNSTSHRDNLLKTVYANVSKAGDYNFAVGMLDQHNLLVNDTVFKLTLVAGYNVVDVEDKQIKVPNGSQLFMDLSSIGTVLKPTDINQKVVPVLVQDNAHESTATGYPGQIFYDAPDYMLPFAYDLIEQDQQQRVANLEKNVSEVNQAVSRFAIKSNELFLVKPNGAKAVLGVSDTGLFATDVVPTKVTVLGNSLTSEHGGIGMAASDQNHDWYHLVSDYILTKNHNAVIKPRFNASAWESATTSADRQAYFDNTLAPLIDADTDLVIIQLVDNVNTDAKLATFGEDAKTLITNIRTKAPHARVLWVAGWFVDDNKINLIKNACLDRGALFVDITAYKNDAQYKGTMGATRTGVDGTSWTVTNPGEALHPGDLGMQKIAEAVEETLNF
ncbi:SGNH/GDSL hydrolase family protein [Lactococcus lactis]|uniref:SGNH/GDSL hydrolase family protein n=1 Tax=Lactococcus lactis TaxID=1358 RepID=UPI0011113A3B|nr:SGNH/GDSL hydrolase family protein [Lactococcus lactis]